MKKLIGIKLSLDLSVSQYFSVLQTLFCLSKHYSQRPLPVRMNGYHVLGVAL